MGDLDVILKMPHLYRVDNYSNIASIAKHGYLFGSFDRMGLSSNSQSITFKEPTLPLGVPLETALAQVKNLSSPSSSKMKNDRIYFFNKESYVLKNEGGVNSTGKPAIAPLWATIAKDSRVAIRICTKNFNTKYLYPDGCFLLNNSNESAASYYSPSTTATHLKAKLSIHTKVGWIPLPSYCLWRSLINKIDNKSQ